MLCAFEGLLVGDLYVVYIVAEFLQRGEYAGIIERDELSASEAPQHCAESTVKTSV